MSKTSQFQLEEEPKSDVSFAVEIVTIWLMWPQHLIILSLNWIETEVTAVSLWDNTTQHTPVKSNDL